jgi:hypothetical protein
MLNYLSTRTTSPYNHSPLVQKFTHYTVTEECAEIILAVPCRKKKDGSFKDQRGKIMKSGRLKFPFEIL